VPATDNTPNAVAQGPIAPITIIPALIPAQIAAVLVLTSASELTPSRHDGQELWCATFISFEEEAESRFVGLLQVEAALASMQTDWKRTC
jgi:hypothetical protein